MRHVVTLCTTAISLVAGATALGAQTRFQLPDTIPDLSRYTAVEECIAAAHRVARSANSKRPVWRDTAIVSARDSLLDSLPPAAVETAGRCSARFNPDSASAKRFQDWMRLYLMANRDAAADTVLRRRIAAVERGPRSSEALYEVLNTAFMLYMDIRPLRWDGMLSTAELMLEKDVLSPPFKHMLNTVLAMQADALEDNATQRRVGAQMLAMTNALSAQEKADPEYQRSMLPMMAMWVLDRLDRNALLDSLRHSTESFLALKRANWQKARGYTDAPLPMFVGQQAPRIVADFWFPPESGAVVAQNGGGPNVSPATASAVTPRLEANPVRPSPGKVSLVVFLRGGCRADAPYSEPKARKLPKDTNCWEAYAIMHRLARQFPGLEMTLVSQTMGFVGDAPPVSPKEEAQIMQGWWLGYHRLPATLAVNETKFFRLPAPDLRRIDYPVPLNVAYVFGAGDDTESKAAYLIDESGIIVHSGLLNRVEEKMWGRMIDALVHRGR